MCTVSSQYYHAVQTEIFVISLHGLDLVKTVLVQFPDGLKRCTRCPQYRAAFSKYSRKIRMCQHTVITVNKPPVPIVKSVDLNILRTVGKTFHNSAHCRIKCLTIAAACKHTNLLHELPPCENTMCIIDNYIL